MKSNNKRVLIFSTLLTILLVFATTPVFAAEDAIPSIRLDVALQENGSAVITETWDVQGVSSGTEYYKAINNVDGMNVHSLLVWDETGTQFKTLDNWDTNLSIEEKARTSGILKTSKGYELCWGIGSYGDHQYTIQYTLDGLVKDYGDYAGFYHQFISELSSAPQSAYIKIWMPNTRLDGNNARISAYGFQGEVGNGSDGSLTVVSSKALGSNDYVNVLCRFDRGLFPMASTANMSFEKLQKSAENANSNLGLYIILGILGSTIVIIISLISFYYSRFKLADGTTVRLPGKNKIDVNWWVPFEGSIPAVYSMMKLLRRDISYEKLMGAYLIRWQEAGYIRMEERLNEGNTKKSKKEEAILLNPDKTPDQGVEQTLYKILTGIADGKDILWTSDIEKQAKELHEKLTVWAEEVKHNGENELMRLGAAATSQKGTILLTSFGFEQAIKIIGFQKYLMDMSKPSEDKTAPRELWGDYLVFATLFNIGEQVLKSMKALDPTHFDSFAGIYGCNSYSMIYLMTMTNHISGAASPSSGMDGAGGVSSVGGGGFSGGGGGGSR
jgi:hypothetical protein